MNNPNPDKTVILVEPSGPMNLGSVARLCVNFGVKDLRLVCPKCSPKDSEAKLMAVKGIDLLKSARQFDCLLDAVADCQKIIATSGRIDHGGIPIDPPDKVLTWSIKNSPKGLIALVFGREDRGLTNEELLLAHKVIRLRSNKTYPSLNISHAVAVVLHEYQRVSGEGIITDNSSFHKEPAPPLQLEACLNDAQDLLLQVGFLLEHTSQSRMAKLRALLQRSDIRKEEVALLRGMVRQLRWAIQRKDS